MKNMDKSLIDAHCRGDKMAFGELVRRYEESLLGYLMRMCRSRELAAIAYEKHDVTHARFKVTIQPRGKWTFGYGVTMHHGVLEQALTEQKVKNKK